MRERRRDNHRTRSPRPMTAGGSGPEASDTRTSAERFLAAADEAITQALSGDSEAFLRASRQTSAQ